MIHSDFSIALDDAFGDGPGVLMISGTGSVAFGRGPTGATARCGGWGPVCGDEGSGAWIGRGALRRHRGRGRARARDGAHRRDSHRGAGQRDDGSHRVGGRRARRRSSRRSRRSCLSVADSGDLRANALLTLAVEELVLHVRALARQLFGDERAALPVALSGGMLSRGGYAPKTTRASAEVGGAWRDDPFRAGGRGARRGARCAAHRRRGDGLES